jgi:hypothetical protein
MVELAQVQSIPYFNLESKRLIHQKVFQMNESNDSFDQSIDNFD